MSNPWGPGGWAEEADRAEAERADAEAAAKAKAKEAAESGSSALAGGGDGSFPSLRDAAAAGKSKKKNKGQTLTFSEFATGVFVGPGGRNRSGGAASASGSKGLTTDELMMLPKGPRERSGDEPDYGGSGRLGGGFRDYGSRVGGGGGGGSGGSFRNEGDGQRGSDRRPFGGGFHDDRKSQTRVNDFEPSRADEVDNWATAKKTAPPPPVNSFNRSSRERYDTGGQASRYDGGGQGSRADEVDNWASGKRPGLGDYKSGSFASMGGERWGNRKGEGFSSAGDRDRERPRLKLNPPSRSRNDGLSATPLSDAQQVDAPKPLLSDDPQVDAPKPRPNSKPNPFGSARPREEILTERGEDWKKLESEIESRSSSRPTSSQSSRPQSPSLNDASASQVRPRVNPFGAAKPREVLLEERGKDWRKIDFELEHRGVNRSETEEERKLKEEVDILRELVKNPTEDEAQVKELALKEKQLERLTRELDDQVRFGKRGGDSRPGSRSGLSDGGRSHDSMERPISRGGEGRVVADVWMSSNEGQRGVHADRERSFQQKNRLSSRERW